MCAAISNPNNNTDDFFPSLNCPITLSPMQEPVIDPHGHSFEKSAILLTSVTTNGVTYIRCPFTYELVRTDKLYLNRALKDVTEELTKISEVAKKTLDEKIKELETKYEVTIKYLEKMNGELTLRCNYYQQKFGELSDEVERRKKDLTQQMQISTMLDKRAKELEQSNTLWQVLSVVQTSAIVVGGFLVYATKNSNK